MLSSHPLSALFFQKDLAAIGSSNIIYDKSFVLKVSSSILVTKPNPPADATSVLFPPTLHDPNRQHLQHLLLQHHDPTVPHQLQGYKAALNNANTIASHNKSCCLAFYESVQCGTLEQTSIEVAVPRNAMECKPIESDLLGNLISMGARNVRMNCA